MPARRRSSLQAVPKGRAAVRERADELHGMLRPDPHSRFESVSSSNASAGAPVVGAGPRHLVPDVGERHTSVLARARYGAINWQFQQYKTEKAYTEKVSARSHERIMQMICDTVGKSARRIGERRIMEVTPLAADKIYDKFISGPNGIRLRQGEKVVGLCRKAWRIMRRLHPEQFDKKHPNPWDDLTQEPHKDQEARGH
jgi:hypothetical protein